MWLYHPLELHFRPRQPLAEVQNGSSQTSVPLRIPWMGGLLKPRDSPGPCPHSFWFSSPGQGLRICMSHKFPGNVDASRPGTSFENLWPEKPEPGSALAVRLPWDCPGLWARGVAGGIIQRCQQLVCISHPG